MPWPVKQALLDLPQVGDRIFGGACDDGKGRILSYGSYTNVVWRPMLERLGLYPKKDPDTGKRVNGKRRMRWHDLRHTYASLMLAFGRLVHYIGTQMGQSSTKLVWDTYGHLIDATGKLEERAVLRKLWKAYQSPYVPAPAAKKESVKT